MLEVNTMKTRWITLAVLTATVGLLGLVPAAQAELRVGPNYRLNADSNPFRGQDQPGFAVNPDDPQHVVQVNANYLERTCEGSVSRDGGKTWSAAVPLPQPAPSIEAGAFNPSCTTNQSVEFGSNGTVYAAATASKSTPAFPDSGVLVFKSTNGGDTWQPGVVAMPSGPGRTATGEKQVGPSYNRASVSVDRGPGGADRLYVSAHDFTRNPNEKVRVASSTDAGETFSPPVDASPSTTRPYEPSEPVVNSDGSITIVWRTVGVEGVLQATRSDDFGQTWSAPVDVAKVTNNGTAGSRTTASPSGTASYPRLAGSPNPEGGAGKLYLVYTQGSTGPTAPDDGYQGADHFIPPDGQVWVQRSANNGGTWSAPKRLSEQTQFPGSRTHQTRHPTISVSPNGRINVVWHDRRHWYQGPGERNCTHSHTFCEDVRLGDTYYSYSDDSGGSYSKPVRISDRSHNNDVGYDSRGSAAYWNWGPQSVTVGGDQQLFGWMDSREGNWDTDGEDTYLAKVDFNASGAAPETNIDQPDAVSRSIALSKLGYPAGNEGALIGGLRQSPHITSSPDPACPENATSAQCPGGVATRNTSAVVIVNETDVAGALAGAVLARANPASVLLSPSSGLPPSVKEEISRLRPGGAFVIGDEQKLSAQVVADLKAAGVPDNPPETRGQGGERKITRLSGATDAATAAAIAAKMDYRTQAEKDADNPAFDGGAVVVNPASKDAGAAAGLAAARRLPVLYVEKDSIPTETQDALTSLDIKETLVIGGPSVVNEEVKGQLPPAKRLGGETQYDTSKAVVAESKERGLPSNVVYAADGEQPMDSALLGGVVARATGMLTLAPAPVSRTAAGQASDFGLSGISRFFLVGAPRDTTAPPAPIITSPPNNSYDADGSFLVRGTAEAGSKVRVFEGTTPVGTATEAAAGGGWAVSLAGVPDGRHTYTAFATDAENNTSSPAAPRSVIVDKTRPTVRAVSPAQGAASVWPGRNVLATFSEPMRAQTIRSTIRLVRKGTSRAIGATVTYDARLRRLTLNPRSALARRTTYTATVTTGAMDPAGNRLARAKSWNFRTR